MSTKISLFSMPLRRATGYKRSRSSSMRSYSRKPKYTKRSYSKGRMSSYRKPRSSAYSRYKSRMPRSTYATRKQRKNVVNMGNLGIELKYLDTEVYEVAGYDTTNSLNESFRYYRPTPGNTGDSNAMTHSIYLPGFEQGDGVSSRIGRQITMKSIHIRGAVSFPSPCDVRYRIMLVQDTQTNGFRTNLSTILRANIPVPDPEPTGWIAPTGLAVSLDAFVNIENQKRFKILYDQQGVKHITTNTVIPKSPGDVNPAVGWLEDDNLPAVISIPFKINKIMNTLVNYTAPDGYDVYNPITAADNSWIFIIGVQSCSNVFPFTSSIFPYPPCINYTVRQRYVG